MSKKLQTATKQLTKLFIATGDVQQCQLIAEGLHVASPENVMAWELDYNQMSKDEKTGQYVQFVSTLSKTPIKLFNNRDAITGQSTDVIAKQKQDEEITIMSENKQKQSVLLWLGIICAMLLLIIGVIVLANMR